MSSNPKFLNIMNQFNSNQKEVEKDKEIEDKNKFSNDKNKKEDYFSPNKEYNKISESQKEQSLYKNDDKLSQNSKNHNNKENNSLKNNLEDIPLYSDREITFALIFLILQISIIPHFVKLQEVTIVLPSISSFE